MRLREKNQLGLFFNVDMQTKIFSIQKKKIDAHTVESERILFEKEVHQLLIDYGNKNYLMSNSSKQISDKIKIDPDKIQTSLFKGLRVGKKITILINENLFYRYLVTENSILCMWVLTEPFIVEDGQKQTYMKYCTFRINFEKEIFYYPENEGNPFEDKLFLDFIRYLIFLEFSELEVVTLKPNQKKGTKKEGKYINESKSDITIVDSTWNKLLIRAGEFSVRGHLRLQPVGVGRLGRRLIFVDEFQKSGYVRNPKKETTNF